MQEIRNTVQPTPGTIRLELTEDEALTVVLGLGKVIREGRYPGRPWRRLAAEIKERLRPELVP